MGDSGIIDVFMQEAREILENIEPDLVQLEEHGGDRETLNRIFRYFHTLKGSSGIAGMSEVQELCHGLENLLDDVRYDRLAVSDGLVDLIFESIDWIRTSLFHEGDETGLDRRKIKLLERITSFAVDNKEKPEAPETCAAVGDSMKHYRVHVSFPENIFSSGIDPLMIMEDLYLLGDVLERKVDTTLLPDLEEMDPEICYMKWDIILRTDRGEKAIRDVFLFVDDGVMKLEEIGVSGETITANIPGMPAEKKLGEILLEKGILTENELHEAISVQVLEKDRLGDIILRKGYATEGEIHDALDEQDRIKRRIETTTVRVDTGRLDKLLNLLGEIVIGQSTLIRISEEIQNEAGGRLRNALHALDRTTREFQEQIMSIRMIPIGPTFEQFRRFVRDTAHSMGKDIHLAIEGGETELDKTMIEQIADPLKHMIRNSIDHGIEDADERASHDKDVKGTIVLRAYHQEGNVYIEVKDDGRGIDLEKVRRKATDLGYIRQDEEISNEKLYAFLFSPGFSTAQTVGDLSGRGVGMDVVKTNIENMRGTVDIASEEGAGTTVKIKLPLTLAIIDGMLVRVGPFVYILPLLSIIESLRPREEDIRTVEGTGEVIHFRGQYVSLLRLYRLFGIEPQCSSPWEGLVVIVETGRTRVALLIDDLIGQQQVVIKSLDNYITGSRAISGAAIMGDGKVALIIDIFGLVNEIKAA